MSRYLVALLAGLASVVVFLAPMTGSAFGLVFGLMLVPLPIAIAGLGWGWMSAFIAAVVAGIGAAIVAVPTYGLIHALAAGLPAAGMTYLLGLNREIVLPDGRHSTEWYPLGRVLGAIVLWASVLTIAAFLIVAGDLNALKTMVQQSIDRVFDAQAELNPEMAKRLTPEVRRQFAERMLPFIPASLGWFLILSMVTNLWLAGRITQQSGQLIRPWQDMTTGVLPRGVPIALMIAILVTFAGGYIGFLAAAVVWACVFAYLLQGLAVIHQTSRGQPVRGLGLTLLYLMIAILPPAGIIVAILGLAEPFSPLRRKHLETYPPTPPPGGPPPTSSNPNT